MGNDPVAASVPSLCTLDFGFRGPAVDAMLAGMAQFRKETLVLV